MTSQSFEGESYMLYYFIFSGDFFFLKNGLSRERLLSLEEIIGPISQISDESDFMIGLRLQEMSSFGSLRLGKIDIISGELEKNRLRWR